MKTIYVNPLSEEIRQMLYDKQKSSHGIEVRRSQMILVSADEQQTANQIAKRLNCSGQYVRQVIGRFNQKGMSSLDVKSRARRDDQRAFKDDARERLREIMICSPREFGQDTSLWTLDLLATVSYEQGLTDHHVHKDTVSETLMQLGLSWKRAKKTLQSPDPNYESKKNAATGSKHWL